MTGLTIADSRDHFERDGAAHVPLLDTVWNAFSEPTDEEWSAYLERRRAQGFTGLLISVLPTLHDRSENPDPRMPFPVDGDGELDVSRFDADYFVRARALAQRAVEAGFTLFLVVLWSNYVPGSPSSAMPPGVTLPVELRDALPRLVAEHFADLEPVLVISGDDPFTDPDTSRMYRDLLHACRAAMPKLLTTFHMWPDAVLPAELIADADLDIMTLQSGHTRDDGAKIIELATRAVADPVARPIINAEPCYEAHGHVRSQGRFSAAEVRQVTWTGLLAGASAGIGYGAHGVWQWHRAGSRFANAGFSGMPLPWASALALPGANDSSFARELWEREALYRARPAQDVLDRDDDGTRAARTDSSLVIYVPSARDVRVAAVPLAVRGWDLEGRRPLVPRIRADGDGFVIESPDTASDAVFIVDTR